MFFWEMKKIEQKIFDFLSSNIYVKIFISAERAGLKTGMGKILQNLSKPMRSYKRLNLVENRKNHDFHSFSSTTKHCFRGCANQPQFNRLKSISIGMSAFPLECQYISKHNRAIEQQEECIMQNSWIKLFRVIKKLGQLNPPTQYNFFL